MKYFLGFLVFLHSGLASAALFGVDAQDLRQIQLIENPGFENGESRWTNAGSGAFDDTSTAANVAIGVKSGQWDAAANLDTLTSAQVNIPVGLYGRQCTASFLQKGGSGLIKAQVINGSSEVLVEKTLGTQSVFQLQEMSFTCPSSGTFAFRLIASGDAPVVYIDQVQAGFFDLPVNVSPVKYSLLKQAVGSVGSAAQIAAGHVLADESFPVDVSGAVSYYHLAADSDDDSGNAKTLTNTGSTPFTGTDLFGATGAADLDGSTQYFSSADSFFNPAGSFSLGGWVAPDQWTSGSIQTFIANESGASDRGFAIFLQSTSGNVAFAATNTNNGYDAFFESPSADLIDGGWHHIAMVYDGTTVYGYIDGALVGSASLASQRSITTSKFSVGSRWSTAQDFLNGKVSNLFFSTSSLSADDIKKIYSYKASHGSNVDPSKQQWTGIWTRSDGKISTQLENGYLSSIEKNDVYWDLSSLDTGSFVELKMQDMALSATVVPNTSFSSEVYTSAPTFPLAHGLGGIPVHWRLFTEGQSIAGEWEDRSDLCSVDATNINCDVSSLTIDGTHRLQVLASMIPGGGVAQASASSATGSGEKNYISNFDFEDNASGWSATGTMTAARTTVSAELPNDSTSTAALKITGGAINDQTQVDFTVDNVDVTRLLKVQFDYRTLGAYADGDYTVEVIADPSGSPATITPTVSAINAGSTTFVAGWLPDSAVTDYRLVIKAAVASSDGLSIDRVIAGPGINAQGSSGVWKQYDLDALGVISSNAVAPVDFKRAVAIPYQAFDGAWRLRFNITLTHGTDSAHTVTITGVTFKDATDYYQFVSIGPAGGNTYANPGTGNIVVNQASSTTSTRLSGDVELDSKPTWADYDPTVNLINDEVVYANARMRATTVTAQPHANNLTTTTLFPNVDYDTANAWDTGTGVYTVPANGVYKMFYVTAFNGSGTNWAGVIKVNGTSIVRNNEGGAQSGTVQASLNLQKGDQVTFTSTNFINNDPLSTNTLYNYVEIERQADYSAGDAVGFGLADTNNAGLVKKTETGSNANGTYIKYEDGTLITTQTWSVVNGAGTAGDVFTTTLTFPHAFIEEPIITVSNRNSFQGPHYLLGARRVDDAESTLTTIEVKARCVVSHSASQHFADLVAIGRWK